MKLELKVLCVCVSQAKWFPPSWVNIVLSQPRGAVCLLVHTAVRVSLHWGLHVSSPQQVSARHQQKWLGCRFHGVVFRWFCWLFVSGLFVLLCHALTWYDCWRQSSLKAVTKCMFCVCFAFCYMSLKLMNLSNAHVLLYVPAQTHTHARTHWHLHTQS